MAIQKCSLVGMAILALLPAMAERLTYVGANGGDWHASGAWKNEASAVVSWTDGATAVVGDVNVVLSSDAAVEGFEWSTTGKRTLTGAGRLAIGAGGIVNGGTGELNFGNSAGLHLTTDQTWTTVTTSVTPLICLDGQHPVTTAAGVTVTVTGKTQLRWNAKAALPATTTFHILSPAYISFSSGNAAFGSPTVILDGNGNRVSFGSVYDQKNCVDGVFASTVHLRNGADMVFNAGYATQFGVPNIVVDGTQAAGDRSVISGSADTELTLGQSTIEVAQGCLLDLALTCTERSGVSAGLVKTGAGTLKLSSPRAGFSGGVDVQAGTLEVAACAGAGTGPLAVASSAALTLSATGSLPNALSGAGTLTKSGTGTLELAGSLTGFAGDVAIQAGVLRAAPFGRSVRASAGAAWAVTGNTAYETDVAPLLAAGHSGGVLAGAGGTMTISSLNASQSAFPIDAEKGGELRIAALSGAGWSKSDGGDVRVDSLAGYTGTTLSVAAGVLQLAAVTDIPAGCVVETSGSGIVQFDSATGYAAEKIAGTKAVAFADGESVTVDTSSTSGVPSQLAVAEGRTLNVTALTGSGDFHKTGAGTLTLVGAESFAGRIFVHEGTLQVSGSAGSREVVVSNGVFAAVGSTTVLRNSYAVRGGRLLADAGASLGTGAIALSAGAELCVTNGGTFACSELAIAAGTVRIARGGVVGTTALTTKSGGTLAVADGSGISVPLTLSGGTLLFEADATIAVPVTQTALSDVMAADGVTGTLAGLYTNNGGKCQVKGNGHIVFTGGGSFPNGNSELFLQGGVATIATNDFTFKAYFGVEGNGRRLIVTDGAKVSGSGSGKGLHIGTGAGVESVVEVANGGEIEVGTGFHVQLGAWNNGIGRLRVSKGGVFRNLTSQAIQLAWYAGATSSVEVVGGTLETDGGFTRGSGVLAELVLDGAALKVDADMTLVAANVACGIRGSNTLDVAGRAVTLNGAWAGDGDLFVEGTGGSCGIVASQSAWVGDLAVAGADLALGAGVDLANGRVSVADGAISVASGQASVPLLAGTSAIKAGAGRLCVSGVDDPACEFIVAAGEVRVAPSGALRPAGEPATWLDASVESSFTKSGTAISRWFDRRGGAYGTYAKMERKSPVYNPNGFDGKPFVDFGVMADSDKGRAGDDRMLTFNPIQNNIRTVFWMIGSRNGGGFLLGDSYVDDSRRCFHRANGPNTTYGAVASDPLWSATNDRGGYVKDGTTWLNGAEIDGTTTGLGGSWDLVSWRLSEANAAAGKAPSATWIASCYNATNGRLNGGQDLAEILIYTNRLTDAEVRATQRYLADKWMPTNAANRVALRRLVMRGEGTSFTVDAGMPVSVADVVVEGRGVTVRGVATGVADQVVLGTVAVAEGAEWDAAGFRGDEVTNVTFAANAVVHATVDAEGASESLVVKGDVTLPASLGFSVTVPEKVVARRTEILKASGGFTGVPSWSRAAGSDPGAVLVADSAARAILLVGRVGTTVFLR